MTFTTMKHAGHLCLWNCIVHYKLYPLFHFQNLPYGWVIVQQCERASPRGQAELLTVVDQVALTEETSQHDCDVNRVLNPIN